MVHRYLAWGIRIVVDNDSPMVKEGIEDMPGLLKMETAFQMTKGSKVCWAAVTMVSQPPYSYQGGQHMAQIRRFPPIELVATA